MFVGYLFAVLAMLSIGALGILSKLADRYGCTPLNTALTLFGGSTVFMALYVSLVEKSTFRAPAIGQRNGHYLWARWTSLHSGFFCTDCNSGR